MPKANKKTVPVTREMNIPKVDKDLTNYHPDNKDGGSSFQQKDWEDREDGFTGFIRIIEARKLRAGTYIFPEDSN